MVWFKVDDSFADHPKVLSIPRGAARLRAVGLWTALGSWCAKHLTDGLFERHMIAEHSGAKVDADHLLRVGLWDPTDDPAWLQFHDWHDWQPSREKVLAERAEAAERMRQNRAKKKQQTAQGSRSPERSGERAANFGPRSASPTRPDPTTAAAAAVEPPPTAPVDNHHGEDLPDSVLILRAALEAHRLDVRWDRLTDDDLAEIDDIVTRHGDMELIRVARTQYRPDQPAAFANAWLPAWRDLDRRSGRLELVKHDPCTQPGHTGTVRHCPQCASEQKAAR